MRGTPFKIAGLIQKTEHRYFTYSFLKLVSTSALPLLTVYFPKVILKQLLNGEAFDGIMTTVALFVAVILALMMIKTYGTERCHEAEERYTKKMRLATGRMVMKMPLKTVEDPKLKDRLVMSNNAADLLRTVDIFQNILSSAVTAVSFVVVVAGLNWVFFAVILALLVIKVLFVKRTVKYNTERRKVYAMNDRKGNYLNKTAYYSAGAAKEIRINSLSDWFMDKVRDYRSEMLNLQYADFNKYASFDVILAILTGVQSFVILFLLAKMVTDGEIDIADFTMYFAAVTSLSSTLAGIITKVGDYSRIRLNFGDFEALKKESEAAADGVLQDNVKFSDTSVEFRNVSFSYPGTDRKVLDHVSFRIESGEKLALVGVNGAGKSTIVKLICRFYLPSEGQILIGGVDIPTIGEKEYRQLISAVFQDYMTFAFTIRENVTLTENEKIPERLYGWNGCRTWIERLKDGQDTFVSTKFDSTGVNLSGGEEQKMAIQRAAYKNGPIMLLDEPTKAMDAKSEAELYSSFRELAEDRTSLIISHRLASAVISDRIILLEDGHIAESGTHEELMRLNGKYAEMFCKQGEAYAAG